MRTQRGFTLIELLVVIAAIGVLSAIVLASLGSARAKGIDAGTKKELTEARSHAEIYYLANNNSYGGICTPGATAPDGTRGVYEMVFNAARQANLSTVNTVTATQGSLTGATCRACAPGSCSTNSNSWAAEVPLKGGGMFCVDSRGFGGKYSGTAASRLGGNDTDCSQ